MPAPTPTAVQDPVADWGNDDLLFTEETRAYAASAHPSLYPILDWPALRAQFAVFDQAAGAARKASRSAGVRACLLGFVGLLLTAALPLLKTLWPSSPQWLGPIAAFFAAASAVLGYSMALHGPQKAQWLSNRYWTERLRQLHFQFIIVHLPLVVKVMRNEDGALARWDKLRAKALVEFNRLHVDQVTDAMGRMESDEAEDGFWLDPEWENALEKVTPSPELDEIYQVLVEQRFEIQRRFSSLKTAPNNLHSSSTRSVMIKTVSDALTLIVLLMTMIGGALLGLGHSAEKWPMLVIAVIAAVCSATIVLLRILNEGLQISSEAERYAWYKASIVSLKQRFDHAPATGRQIILCDLERLAYQEMRWFMVSFKQARFIM
jgi:hypothetical protein